jgi:Mor family transcriptional regulator
MSSHDFIRAAIGETWAVAVGTSPSMAELERAVHRVTERLAPDFGGLSVRIYVAKRTQWQKSLRAREIRSQWDGGNCSALAERFGLSERQVRRIVGVKPSGTPSA